LSASPAPGAPLLARRLAKSGLAGALSLTGADRLIGRLRGAARAPLVLGYHGIVEDRGAHPRIAIPALFTSREMFETHLDWVGRRYRFVTLDELGEKIARGDGNGDPIAAVTFDDGYANVYHHAFPVLRRRGIPAAIFVVSDLVGGGRPHLHDYLYLLLARAFATWTSPAREIACLLEGLGPVPVAPVPAAGRAGAPRGDGTGLLDPFRTMALLLRDLPQSSILRVVAALESEVPADPGELHELLPATWEMLARMQEAGVTIGSHTRSHRLLTNESRAAVFEEVAGSKRTIEDVLEIEVRHFAYPGGRFDALAVEAVRAAGYRTAFTACRHRDPRHPLLTIPRRLLWENACLGTHGRFSPSVMSCQVNGVFDLAGPCSIAHAAGRVED
jgi:peptidoglycan/xylan/chitin deacetylase (PgdA/CDA1 family)